MRDNENKLSSFEYLFICIVKIIAFRYVSSLCNVLNESYFRFTHLFSSSVGY